ncbi:hypothetical protein CgunFtcFv8_007939 [Champsocephalus gunnari]|uniref:Uncharacterized protein n=1 Tax=Champsocephalus gunnari TaxID=52237 RepID=A0AAN8HID6_CHAGU|nr:hypothetical protein CgunFtcFv8_007939 [Champsocephalus gunnari]
MPGRLNGQWNSLGSRTSHWMERGITPGQRLPTGYHQPGAVWKTIKHLRVGEGRCVASMKKWKNFQCVESHKQWSTS